MIRALFAALLLTFGSADGMQAVPQIPPSPPPPLHPPPGGLALEPRRHGHTNKQELVVIGRDLVVEREESVDGDVVVVNGGVDIRGTINGDLALVGARGLISGTVNGDVSCVISTIRLDNRCTINGDLVSVGSAIDRYNGASVNGSRTSVDVLPRGSIDALGRWFSATVLFFRPMSPGDFWSWSMALGVLAFCLALGVICPGVLDGTAQVLEGRAPASFLAGIAIVPGTALLCFLLLLTVVGIVAIPVLLAAVLVLALVGNAAIFQAVGRRLVARLGERPHVNLLQIACGAAVLWVLYCIPVIGFLAGSLVFLGGLGAFALYLLDLSRARQNQGAHLAEPVQHPPADAAAAPRRTDPGELLPSAMAVPRATFWPRLVANLIDLAVVFSILFSLGLTRVLIPTWVLYRFGMYAWRSTTLGGMALRLHVIKGDGTPLSGDVSTSLVRALGSLLSLLPLGLGFLWILFDPERNAWHDHLSRTFVVQMQTPRPSPLPPPAPATP